MNPTFDFFLLFFLVCFSLMIRNRSTQYQKIKTIIRESNYMYNVDLFKWPQKGIFKAGKFYV